MHILGTEESEHIKGPVAIAMGNFDGVHRGHRLLISRCVQEAKEQGWNSCVLTFEPHPNMILEKNGTFKLLNTYEQKYRMLESLGVDYLYLLPFNNALASVEPAEFVQRYLLNNFQVGKIFVGFNFTFGNRGKGTARLLRELGTQNGFDVWILDPVMAGEQVVSSTAIREKYLAGDIRGAASMLGYWPVIEGPVTGGEKRGRKMGFPTANIAVAEYVLLPSYGVYAAFAVIEETQQILPAIINIGVKPTFGSDKPTVEAYILGYQGDLYAKHMALKIVRNIRPEKRFKGLEQLREQIARDIEVARRILSEEEATFGHKNPSGK